MLGCTLFNSLDLKITGGKMKTKMLILIIFIFSCTAVLAQGFQPVLFGNPVSFRSQALGGAIFDDLDLVYDPIELRFVDGVRIYTNLSNLTSTEEQVLNNISDNEFLFGASWKNRFTFDLWTSFLVRYQKSRFSNPVSINSDLTGGNDLFGEGNLSNVYAAFLDTSFPPDGLYDIKQTISQEKTNFSNARMQTLILNNSLLLSDLTVGLQLVFGKESDELTTASGIYGRGPVFGAFFGDPSASLKYDRFQVQENLFKDYSQNVAGNFSTSSEHNFTHIYLSFMKPFNLFTDSLELRADLGYLKESFKSNINDQYSGSVENFEQDIPDYLDRYSETEALGVKQEDDGNGFLVGISAKKVFKKAPERKNDGFWRVRLGFNRNGFDYTYNDENPFRSEDKFFDGTDTLFVDENHSFTEDNTVSDNGDGTYKQYFASGLVNLPLGERVSVGIGVLFSSADVNRTTEYVESFSSVEDFERVDDTLTFNDFQTTITEGKSAKRTFESRDYLFRFPVGIEYKFTKNKKWSLRFGSIFTYNRIEESDALEITDSRPLVNTIEYGDGTVEETINDNISESVSSHRKEAQSQTTFVYGLGFTPTDNLQIDLLGFLGTTAGEQILDTEFYRKLRISFTLKL
jgi:hypothetical protein